MTIELQSNSQLNSQKLYDTDYNLWLIETIKHLQNRDIDALDWENLIDEVVDLGKREKRKIESLLIKLLEHLLILQYWQEARELNRGHWEREITNFRLQIIRQLADSPSLQGYLQEKLPQCYEDGRKLASKHSQLPINTFPREIIGDLLTVLDENCLS